MNSLNLLIGTILYEFNAYIIRGFLENENIPYQFKNITFHIGAAPIADLIKFFSGLRKKMWDMQQSFSNSCLLETELMLEDEVCRNCGEILN